jgi:hypothetical protein
MGKMYNKFRLEELPVVADLLLQLMNRDRHYFASFSSEFNDAYIADVQTQILRIQDLIPAQIISAEKSKLTSLRYQVMGEIMYILDRIDAYVRRASDQLNVHADDFGIREAKQDLKRKNVEGSLMRIKEVEQNISLNLQALQIKGYKIELGEELLESTEKMAEMNLLKVEMISRRKQLVIQNHTQYQLLWNYILEISDIGKLVMRLEQAKANEYKFCNLLKHIRKTATVLDVS